MHVVKYQDGCGDPRKDLDVLFVFYIYIYLYRLLSLSGSERAECIKRFISFLQGFALR